MHDPIADKPLLSPRKIALQVIFWLCGLGLLALVIHGAFDKGGGAEMWQRIRAAPPHLLVALLGCTLASAVLNGSTFWLTVQPLRAVRWRDMNLLNVFAGMLNYAPVRLGAIVRVAYHMRVDRLTLVQIGGWFALIGCIMLMGIGATLLATLVHERIDWIWLAIVLAQMIVGGAAMRFVATVPIIARHARGLDRMVVHRRGLWGAIALRLLDLGAYAGRMGAAMAILGLHLPWSHVIVLAMVALAAGLTPFGKVGVREYCVALMGARLNIDAASVDKTIFEQLSLLESAGEALVFIPLGALALPWFRARWRHARSASNA